MDQRQKDLEEDDMYVIPFCAPTDRGIQDKNKESRSLEGTRDNAATRSDKGK